MNFGATEELGVPWPAKNLMIASSYKVPDKVVPVGPSNPPKARAVVDNRFIRERLGQFIHKIYNFAGWRPCFYLNSAIRRSNFRPQNCVRIEPTGQVFPINPSQS